MKENGRPSRFARMWLRTSAKGEERGQREHRQRLVADLRGHVVEVGCGQGLNFPHYPAGVERVTALEPEPTLRDLAVQAAAAAPIPIEVRDGVAQDIPLEDASADAVVASLVLCSVPDQPAALAELRRVLRPAGELRFYEHVIANRQPLRLLLKLADGTGIWPALAGGCHAARDTGPAIEQAGFAIEELDRFPFSPERFQPSVPHILGRARATP